MKFLLDRCIRPCCLLLLLQSGFAQEVSFRITPLRPVRELRAAALKEQPPREQGRFREPDLVELVKLDPAIKLDIRYATTNNFLGTPYTPRRGRSFRGKLRKRCSAPIVSSSLTDTA